MKRDELKEKVSTLTTELPMIYNVIKKKYIYRFRQHIFIDNFLISPYKQILKHILHCNPSKTNHIMLEILDEPVKEDIKIIFIKGTIGQDYTAYLLTKYLRAYGKKATLLSSLSTDNPMVRMTPEIYIEDYLRSQEFVMKFIKAGLDYNTDYIVIEYNEKLDLADVPHDRVYDVEPFSKSDFKNLLEQLEVYDEELFKTILTTTVPGYVLINANNRTFFITKDYTTIAAYITSEDNIWNTSLNLNSVTIMVDTDGDRITAIRDLIDASNEGDTMFITGRGADQVYKIGEHLRIFTDEQIVRKKLEELQWL